MSARIKKVKPKLGLKTHWSKEQLKTRLKHNPAIIELYLANGDLENKFDEIKKVCDKLSDSGIRVIVHQPLMFNGGHINFSVSEEVDSQAFIYTLECIDELDALGYEFIMHAYNHYPDLEMWKDYTEDPDYKRHIHRVRSHEFLIENIKKYASKKMFLENVYLDIFCKADDINNVVKETGVKLCIDLSHLYLNDKDSFYDEFVKLKPDYLHINDAKGKLDSVEIGLGEIDFSKLSLEADAIIEVRDEDHVTAEGTYRSFEKIKEMFGYE